MSPSICWILFAVTAQPATPKDVLIAYARAMETQNYKAMAGFILGGKTDFDYQQLVKHSPDFDSPCQKVLIQVGNIDYSGDTAVASYGIDYFYSKKGDPVHYDGKVKLVRDHGSWKIRNTTREIGFGYDIGIYASKLVYPEETLKHALNYFEPTRNHTEPTFKLGMARAKFLGKVLAQSAEMKGRYPYNGYWSTSEVGTTFYWPVGKSDELIMAISFAGPTYGCLTKWNLIGGRVQRVWQVDIYESKGPKLAKGGTLAKVMKIQEVPSKVPQDVIRTLSDSRPYAAYSAGHFFDYWCRVVLPDGSIRPVIDDHDPEPTMIQQYGPQASRHGFFITPHEVALMEKNPPIKALK